MAMRRILWKAGGLIRSEEVGGMVSRTLDLDVGSGKVTVRRTNEQDQQIVSCGSPDKAGRLNGI
jgi:chemotaxis receptor (MCP) glutamine deamidase CheD